MEWERETQDESVRLFFVCFYKWFTVCKFKADCQIVWNWNEWMDERIKKITRRHTTHLPQRYTHKVGFCGLLLLLLLVASPLTVVADREWPGLQDILDSTRILQLLFFMFKYYLTKKSCPLYNAKKSKHITSPHGDQANILSLSYNPSVIRMSGWSIGALITWRK